MDIQISWNEFQTIRRQRKRQKRPKDTITMKFRYIYSVWFQFLYMGVSAETTMSCRLLGRHRFFPKMLYTQPHATLVVLHEPGMIFGLWLECLLGPVHYRFSPSKYELLMSVGFLARDSDTSVLTCLVTAPQ